MEVKIDSGIETAIIEVLRQLPRNSSSITAVSKAAISASCMTPMIAALTNTDWSNNRLIFEALRQVTRQQARQRSLRY